MTFFLSSVLDVRPSVCRLRRGALLPFRIRERLSKRCTVAVRIKRRICVENPCELFERQFVFACMFGYVDDVVGGNSVFHDDAAQAILNVCLNSAF